MISTLVRGWLYVNVSVGIIHPDLGDVYPDTCSIISAAFRPEKIQRTGSSTGFGARPHETAVPAENVPAKPIIPPKEGA